MLCLTIFAIPCAAQSDVAQQQSSAAEKPNVIVILADDLGYADVGFTPDLGFEDVADIPTPHIDALAAAGVAFTAGYVSYPVCSPSRAGLLTGRHQGRFGHHRNVLYNPEDPDMGLPLSQVTLAETLGKAGYASAAIGKWHLGAHEDYHPLSRGFDFFYGFLGGGHRYFPDELTAEAKPVFEYESPWDHYKTKLMRNRQRVDETEYLTRAFTREALAFIERRQEEPFFLYLSYNAPHGPLQAPEEVVERFGYIENRKRRLYTAMVSVLDEGVGRVLGKLRALGIEEQTIVFFLSDNGGPEEDNGSDNGPLRGDKGQVWEGGIRVPFAMQWPGHVRGGQVYESPVSALDIYATAHAAADARQPEDKPLDGVDLVPYVTGERSGPPHEELFWSKGDDAHFALRRGEMKLSMPTGEGEHLYRVGRDVAEQNNLLRGPKTLQEQEMMALEELRVRMQWWQGQMAPPAFLGLMQREEYEREWKRRRSEE